MAGEPRHPRDDMGRQHRPRKVTNNMNIWMYTYIYCIVYIYILLYIYIISYYMYIYIYIDLVMEFIFFDGSPKTMVVCILNQGLMTWMMWGYLDFKKPPHGPQAQPGNGTGKDLFPKPGWTVIQLLEEKISIGLSANGRFLPPEWLFQQGNR